MALEWDRDAPCCGGFSWWCIVGDAAYHILPYHKVVNDQLKTLYVADYIENFRRPGQLKRLAEGCNLARAKAVLEAHHKENAT